MRPTGRLHLGNYTGALENWLEYQKQYRSFFMVADLHALTTDLDTGQISQRTREMVIDWLAAGLDPERAPLFVQSQVPEHAELHLVFSMLITLSRLERNPTVKEQVRDLGLDETVTYGHIGYPVLQAADILLYKGDLVPVGEDQAPHVEITREIARRFNNTFGDVFPIPQAKLTRFARFPGVDGQRMSKSLGNAVNFTDPPEEIRQRLRKAAIDPERVRQDDPGHPEACTVYTYHQRFNSADDVAVVEKECRAGPRVRGCFDCKMEAADRISEHFAPARERRATLEADPARVDAILQDGNQRARETAHQTMREVRSALGLGGTQRIAGRG
ncbi:MAG: tryptophan--tRNA ligase [Candidatus Latescibacterota bacterium]|nr:MAG: tryptophan--tRNA ligase [Candidatus Latescibacterota bacterium]